MKWKNRKYWEDYLETVWKAITAIVAIIMLGIMLYTVCTVNRLSPAELKQAGYKQWMQKGVSNE
jgi:succinate dehydrogenase hydrophobic anchor subunit